MVGFRDLAGTDFAPVSNKTAVKVLAPSQSVSQKRFHQCVNHKKKLSLRRPLPTFDSFSFFQASI